MTKKTGTLTSIPIKSPHIIDLQRQTTSLFTKRTLQEADYQSPTFDPAARDVFERLTDNTRLDYISKNATDAGLGVAGVLWSETSTQSALARVSEGVQSIGSSIHRRVGLLAGLHPEVEDANAVLWRDIETLAEDPDQVSSRLHWFVLIAMKIRCNI